MKKYIFLTVISTILLVNCDFLSTQKKNEKDAYVINNYNKKEVDIVMRDGTKLHTTIYSPKDNHKTYPILMQRTPYSSAPYGKGNFKTKIGPNVHLMKEGNIVVYQDVRGRWMSEGVYDNMRAYIPNKKETKQMKLQIHTTPLIGW